VLYRVVQEALANAARYAPRPGVVGLTVQVGDTEASVRVENACGEPHASAGGFGLTGLREQVAAVGGELSGGRQGDRWVVAGRLPVVRRAVPSA
jgi:glucose-6-phosphate-specific signal transduction histidine kinase